MTFQALRDDSFHLTVRFDEETENFLRRLADQIQSNVRGQFFSLLDSRAILFPVFHMKILSSFGESSVVGNVLRETGTKFEQVTGTIQPICRVSYDGLVSLKLNCENLLMLVSFLTDCFPGSQLRFSSLDDVFVDIGRFSGPQLSAFEAWLNNEFSINSSVFPSFRGKYIESFFDSLGR